MGEESFFLSTLCACVHDSDVSTTYRFSFRFHFDMMMLLFLGAECESRQELFFAFFLLVRGCGLTDIFF